MNRLVYRSMYIDNFGSMLIITKHLGYPVVTPMTSAAYSIAWKYGTVDRSLRSLCWWKQPSVLYQQHRYIKHGFISIVFQNVQKVNFTAWSYIQRGPKGEKSKKQRSQKSPLLQRWSGVADEGKVTVLGREQHLVSSWSYLDPSG